MTMQRREFLKLSGLASAAMLASPRLVFSADGATDRPTLVCLFLRGGADGLNLVVPYAESRYYDLRPNIGLAPPGTAGGVLDLDGFFGLHPDAAALMPLFRSGELAIVHAAGSPDDSRSHFDAQDYMELGFLGGGGPDTGWLDRHLALMAGENPETFRAVSFGRRIPLSLHGPQPVIGLSSLDGFDLAVPDREKALITQAVMDIHSGNGAIQGQGQQIFAAVDTLDMISGNGSGGTYPATQIGEQLAQVAQLIRADVGLEIACVEIDGWDHHDQIAPQLSTLTAQFSDALAAFHTDLGPDMDNVMLVTMTEFGRRVRENASRGTDHGHGSVMFAAGAGVNGGIVHGEWPTLAEADLNRGDLEVTTDFRSVLSDALIRRAGVAGLDGVFPEFSGATQLGIW